MHVWPIEDGRKISRRLIEEIIDRGALESSRLLVAEYPDGGGEIYCGDDQTEISSVMIAHFGGPTIIDRTFEIAERTESLIFWSDGPDGPCMAVTNEKLIARLPEFLRQSDSPVVVAADARHLSALIGRNYDVDRTQIIDRII